MGKKIRLDWKNCSSIWPAFPFFIQLCVISVMQTKLFITRFMIVLAALALLPPSVAVDSPWFIGSMAATVTFSGDINIAQLGADRKLNWLEASFYIAPQDTPYQSIELVNISPATYSMQTDTFGNRYVKFRWTKPDITTLHYGLVWNVDINQLKYAISGEGALGDSIPEAVSDYLVPDNLTRWTGFIKAKAESLTANATSTLDAARRLSQWVSSRITYDLSCWDGSYSAEWVFENRIGVCDEFTNLFLSMARSVGIPARYVEGIVYSGEKWNFHAWAEVYAAGAWLPVDPTYNEVGFIDSSHVLLARVKGDADVQNRLKWEGVKIEASFGPDEMIVTDFEPSEGTLVALNGIFKEEIIGGESLQVNVSARNLANSPMAIVCSLGMPAEMIYRSVKEQSVILHADESALLSWTIAAPLNLDKAWLHKMPLSVKCFPSGEYEGVLTVDPRESVPLLISAGITDLTAVNGSDIFVIAKNDGTGDVSGAKVFLCINNASNCVNKTVSLQPGEEKELGFLQLSITEGTTLSSRIEFEGGTSDSSTMSINELDVPDQGGTGQPSPLSKPVVPKEAEKIVVIVVIAVVILAILIVAIAIIRRH